MARRGPKPTATILKLITGNAGKRPLPEGEPETKGALLKPKYLRGRGIALWQEVSENCFWLGDADSYKLGMWCALQAEFEKSPKDMTSARIAQLRALGSELGLDPASRSRLGTMKGSRGYGQKVVEQESPAQPAKGYFDR